jgi:hypothetical protein
MIFKWISVVYPNYIWFQVEAIQKCGGQTVADGCFRTGGGILWNIVKSREPKTYKEIMDKGKELEVLLLCQSMLPLVISILSCPIHSSKKLNRVRALPVATLAKPMNSCFHFIVNSHYPFNTILRVIQKRQVSFGFNMSQSCNLKTLCRPHHYH